MKQKLSQRTKFNLTEVNVLTNAFKFYDLANCGICNKSQWIKTIGKIGLSGFSERELSQIFDVYDLQGKGFMEYRSFITELFSPKSKISQTLPIKHNINEGSYKIENEEPK